MTLNPIQLLELALKVDRRTATIIVMGLIAFTAVAMIKTLGIDDPAGSALAVIYVIGAGFVVSVLAKVMNDTVAQTALSWAVTVVIILFMATVAYGAIVPRQTLVNPPSCILQFWVPCNQKLDQIASAQPPVTPVAPVPTQPGQGTNSNASPSPATPLPSAASIYVQFAGLISRDNMIKVSRGLAAQGWKVQGSDRGGERTQAAAGLNEVRYSNQDLKTAAERLARELSATGITNQTIRARQVDIPRFPSNTMEVWISN